MQRQSVDSQSLITYLSFYRNWRPELLEHKAREGAAVEAKKQALLQAASGAVPRAEQRTGAHRQ